MYTGASICSSLCMRRAQINLVQVNRNQISVDGWLFILTRRLLSLMQARLVSIAVGFI